MLLAVEARSIAEGTYSEELKYIEDTISTAAEMHTSSCLIKEEISEAAKQVLKTAGYGVRIINFYIY